MNKRFFNQQNLTRRLRLLPVLFAMLLMPIGAWAEDYGFSIGGVAVGSGNIASFQNSGVSYDADLKTLTLENATIDRLCVNVTSEFIIDLKGKNTITASTDTAGIFSNINPTASLPITIKSSSTPVGSLTITPGSNSYMAYSGVSFTYQNGLSLIPDAQYLGVGQTAVVGVSYGLTVAGVQVTNANAAGIAGDGITGGTVTFTPASGGNSAVLTLSGATINGSIVKTASEAGDQLTINLVGTNTVNGQISFQDRTLPGDLTFTGNGLLNIASNVANGVIDGVSSVNTDEGLYIATDSPNPNCHDGYYTNSINADDNSVKSLTVSTGVTYPIWVYNSSSSTKYTQLTAASSTFTTANVDDAHSGSVSFNGTTLTLNSFNCKETNENYVFYIGESKKELTINLDGTSCIFGNCFHYLTGNNTLTFKTSESTPGSLEFTTSPSFSGDVTFVYSSGLGYYSNKISTDWPRLQIGNTYVRGTATPVEGYSKVSFDDATNTLTLGGVTIGTQNSTNTDITVYIKDLNVEISGTNTVYGRFYGFYQENGYRAGTITFKKKSGAETAELTVSGLGDGNGPVTNFASSILGEGLYVSGIDDDSEPVSTLSYQGGEYCDFDNPDNTVKEVTISENEPDTKLWIGETPVTSDNAGNVFHGDEDLDGKVSYDVTNHTLSLNGATIENEIVSNVGTLTINLTGSNSVNSISATGNATALAFTGTSTATLNLSNSDGVISGFSSVNTGDFNLLSNSTPGIHYSGDKKALVNYDNYNAGEVTLTHAEVYPLWIGNIQVTGNNETSITGEGITKYNDGAGSITFDPDNNLLTFDGVSLHVTNNRYIVSGLEDLSIKIKGNNYFNSDPYLTSDALVSTIEGASLTFSAEGDDPRLEMLVSRDPFSSFTVNYDKTYSYINTGQGLTDIYALKAPTVSLVDNVPTINSAGINDNGENINYYYTIDCEGTEYDVAETLIENGSTTLELSKPCIVTAYAKYTFGNQKTTQSSVNTGKYFGPAEDPMRLVYGADPVDFVLAPAIEEGDGIIINGIEANVTYSSTTGKVSSSTLGRNGAIVSLGYVDANNKTTILLNNSFDMNFDVVPLTATITCDKGQNDPYLNTQVITLSQTAIDGYNTKIFYAWETGETEVNVPTDTFEQPGTEYNSETTIHPQVGKLKAWVGYHLGDNEYLNSEVTTLEITAVKTDFTDAVVSCPTSAAYTGSAINPEITVKASAQAENNLVKDEDYTVSYKKVGEGEALTDVTSMVDAGSYKIIITGAGNYVGSISKDFEIVRASVDWNATGWTSPEAKTDLTFTNEAKDLITGATVPDGVTVNYCYKYSTSEFDEQARSELPDPANWTTTVPQGTNAGYYAVFYKVEESANYEGWGPCEVALQTSIAKAAISEVVVNITGWTYGGYDEETNAPSVTEASNPGNGEVTYLYKENKDGANFSGDVPTAVGAYIVQATVPETDNYLSQTGTATFSITAKSITDEMVTLSPTSFVYSGVAQTPTVTVKDGETPLTQAENAEAEGDYTVAFSNNTNAALSTSETAPTVTIIGKGNYTGTATKTFTIDKAQLTVTADDKTYNVGDDITLTVTITGFVNGETETVLTAQPTASCDADVTKPGSYTITVNGGEAANYDFDYKTGTLTINRLLDVSFSASNEWATYYGSENLAKPEGLKAYQVTAVDGSTVTIGEIGYIPANTAVLLKNVSNNNTWSNIAASAYTGATSTFASNKLIGTAEAVNVSDISGGTVYVLYNNMFKRATGGTIPANRGYLVVAPSSGNAPELSITIGDDTTGIGTVGCDSVATDNDEWYTLDGQKLQQAPTQKGLYIKNGKKVVINKK